MSQGNGPDIPDPHREITPLQSDELLFSLIVGPVTEAMRRLGFVDVYGKPELGTRKSRDGGYVRSRAHESLQAARTVGLQRFHTEGNPKVADEHGLEFAVYTLTAGPEGAEVHLCRGHMGGHTEKYVKGKVTPTKVILELLSPGNRVLEMGY